MSGMGLLNTLVCREIVKIDEKGSLKEAIRLMRERGVSSILIEKDDDFIGIITERDLVKAAAVNENYLEIPVQAIMSPGVVGLIDSTPLDEALFVMESKQIRHLLIHNDEDITYGIVTHTDIVRKLEEDFFKAPRPVKDFMTTNIQLASPRKQLKDIIASLHEERISCLIIVDKGQPIGIVTERDVVRYMQQGVSRDTLIENIMSTPIVTIAPDTTLYEASRVMEKHLIRHLVVWDGKAIAGLLTNTDLVKSIRDNYRSSLEKEAMRTRRILDLIHEGVVEVEADSGEILWVNQTGAKLFGYREIHRVVGRRLFDLMDMACADVVKEDFINRISRNNLQCSLTVNNNKLTVLTSYQLMGDENEEQSIYRMLIRDITNIVADRKQMEEELLKQKRQFQALFDNTADAIVFFDNNHIIQRVNPQFLEMYGYEYREVIGQNIRKIVNPNHRMPDNYLERILAGEFISEETMRFDKRGNSLTVLLKGGPVIVDDVVTGGYAVYSDITERKKMLTELRYSEAKNRSLIDSMNEGMVLLDIIYEEGQAVDYRLLETNQAFERQTGVKGEHVVQRLASDVFKMSPPPYLLEVEHVVKTGEYIKMDTYVEIIDKYLRMSIFSPMPGYFAVLFDDISEEKKKEDQINYLIYHDILTGLYNRAYFEKQLKIVDVEENLPITVVMADVNNLKLINDAFGHDKGDDLIKIAASIIKEETGQLGMAARLGGDEFVIILDNMDEKSGEEFVQKLRQKIDESTINGVSLSVSLGMATKTQPGQNIYDIIQKSDIEMYNRKFHESREAKDKIIESLMAILEHSSNETMQHCQRVKKYSVALAQAYGLSQKEIEKLKVLALLHDIGVALVPSEIIHKEGPLTEEEWEIIKKHPENGYRIIKAIPEFALIAEDLLCHHERIDGTGYPQGLEGDDIPITSRILSIADAYEIMTKDTPYKKAMNDGDAINELLAHAGSQFDDKLVRIFIDEVLNKGPIEDEDD